MRKNKNNQTTLYWLWKVSGKNKLNILWLTLFEMIFGISSVIFAWILRSMIDRAVAKDVRGFWIYVAEMIGLIVLQLMLRAVIRFFMEYTKAVAENKLKKRLFSVLLSKDYAAVTAIHTGEWMNRLTSDTVVVSNGLTTIFPNIAGMLVKLIGALSLLLYLISCFSWILIPGGIFFIVLTYSFRKILKRLHKNIQEVDGKLRVFLSERLGSLLVIRAFAREKQILDEAVRKMEAHKVARMKRNHFSNISNIGFGVLMNGCYVLGAVYCGYGILTDKLSYGTFIAVLQLISQIQSPFASLTGYLPQYYAMIASAERLMEAETFEDGIEAEELDKVQIEQFYAGKFCSIHLENVFFTYQSPVKRENSNISMPTVIENINLEIKKGEYIAFTGISGCGKSTLLKLIMCLYPLDSGKRYMTICGGKGKEKVPLNRRYIRLFSYVPQGNYLMSGTIREIVSFSEEMGNDELIWRALYIACADEFVRKFPEGMDTLVGEHGAGLSEGQMQRLAIARAIYSDNPILILDESTSALDVETEEKLLLHLRSMTDKTVLIITHRPAILTICDRQVFMEEKGIMKSR